MKITCIVVDDEPLALQLMESYARKTPFLDVKGAFSSAQQAYDFLSQTPVDLLFCDIQMPFLSGMELSRMLPQGTRVIFTTAFGQYALEGFKVNAIDYLLKPISYEDFLTSAKKALSWFEATKGASTVESAPKDEGIRSIFVKTEYRLQQIDLDDILYIEGMKDYVKIYTQGAGDPVVSLTSMKSLEEELPKERFFRVQRSYIVNTGKVRVIERGRIVFGDKYIPISENTKDELYAILSKHSVFPKE